MLQTDAPREVSLLEEGAVPRPSRFGKAGRWVAGVTLGAALVAGGVTVAKVHGKAGSQLRSSVLGLTAGPPPEYPWEEPDITKVSRSPCPMLNSLANHGMLPRDGRQITANMFADALKTHLNLNWQFWWNVANTTIMVVKPQQTAVDLHDIAMHNGIQHDAALTRNDRGQGQYFTRVNRTLVDQLMALNVSGYLTYDSMGRARHLRQQQCAAWNPDYTLPGEEPTIHSDPTTNKKFLAIDQAAVPLLVLSDPLPGTTTPSFQVEVERLRSFFYYERLPYEFGWKPSTVEFGGPTQVFAGIAKLLEYYNKYQGQTIESPIGLHAPPPPNPNPDY